jgi:hypothetical protein
VGRLGLSKEDKQLKGTTCPQHLLTHSTESHTHTRRDSTALRDPDTRQPQSTPATTVTCMSALHANSTARIWHSSAAQSGIHNHVCGMGCSRQWARPVRDQNSQPRLPRLIAPGASVDRTPSPSTPDANCAHTAGCRGQDDRTVARTGV